MVSPTPSNPIPGHTMYRKTHRYTHTHTRKMYKTVYNFTLNSQRNKTTQMSVYSDS